MAICIIYIYGAPCPNSLVETGIENPMRVPCTRTDSYRLAVVPDPICFIRHRLFFIYFIDVSFRVGTYAYAHIYDVFMLFLHGERARQRENERAKETRLVFISEPGPQSRYGHKPEPPKKAQEKYRNCKNLVLPLSMLDVESFCLLAMGSCRYGQALRKRRKN